MQNNSRRISLNIAVAATILALTVILGWIPYGGVFLLPMLFTACNFDFKLSVFAGVAFGVFSLAYSYLMGGAGLLALYFIKYPWLPIVPRTLTAMIAYGVFRLLTKFIKTDKLRGKILSISITAAVGTLSNTVFIGSLLFILYYSAPITGAEMLALAELAGIGSLEIVINAVVLPTIVLATRKALPKLFNELVPNHPFNALPIK